MTATHVADALVFGSADEFFDALFGPSQHDAHVECWRGNKWLVSREAHAAAANLRCADLVARCEENEARKLAQVHNYNIIALRGELYRWEGEFSRNRFASTRVRQLRRAIEIARERDAETLVAAE